MQLTSISRLLGLFGFAAALLLHPSLAMACFPEWRSFEEVVLTADDVFVGRITSSKTLSAESITNPSTIQAGIDEAQVDVTESLKGTKIANQTVYAVQLGTCSRELVVGSKCLFTTTDQHGFDVIIVATLACETDDVSDNDDGLLLERYIQTARDFTIGLNDSQTDCCLKQRRAKALQIYAQQAFRRTTHFLRRKLRDLSR